MTKQTINKLIILIIIISIYVIIFNKLNKSKIKIENTNLIYNIINDTKFSKENDKTNYFKYKLIDLYNNPIKYTKFNNIKISNKEVLKEESSSSIKNEPIIYIYNTHQTEEYAVNDPNYVIKPTITTVNYIMEEVLEKNYNTLVEERSIKEILNTNNWKYSYSYKASRIYLEDVKTKYPSLKYYIDVHRDSISKEKTTITINNKSYAKLLFIVGLDNQNYQENLQFTEKIHNKINELYPNLSKGIYKKSGVGVNGIYNQDFSPYVILVEVGGYENTITEVMNSSIAFSECFLEVINEYK